MPTPNTDVLAAVAVLDQPVAHISKSQLIAASKLAMKFDFNRKLKIKELRRLPEANYPVLKIMPHNHRHMERCEPHNRLVIELPDPSNSAAEPVMAMVDVTIEFAATLRMRKAAA